MKFVALMRQAIFDKPEDRPFRVLCAEQMRRNEFRRIYHYHIRKTAGTTINYAFLSNFAEGDLDATWTKLFEAPGYRLVTRGKVIVACNRRLINQGCYNYGFSHMPFHAVRPPRDTFTFACFRDPVKRVISHYNMLRYFETNGIDHSCMVLDGTWLGKSFRDFLNNAPRSHLLNQLYMFSKRFSIDEAVRNIRTLSYFMFTEDLIAGLQEISRRLSILLPVSNQKQYGHKETIDEESLTELRRLVQPEYELLARLRASDAPLARCA